MVWIPWKVVETFHRALRVVVRRAIPILVGEAGNILEVTMAADCIE
jgi:hypothetical protein